MKNKIVLSTLALAMLSGANVQAAEDLSSMFSEGKASGQVRMFFVDREYQGTANNTTHRNATAIGGYLKFETAAYEGLNLATAFYTTNGAFLKSPKTDYTQVDMTLLGPDNEDYSMIGELYAQYTRGNTTLKLGRQKLDTPMAGSDDARMLPNLFEAYLLINKDIPDTTIIAGHVTRFAQGTFGRVYNHSIYRDPTTSSGSKLLSATSGYSYVDSLDQAGDFVNAGKYAVGENTKGVSVVSATYTGVENLKVQLWDYYAHDILNAIYGEANYSWKCLLTDAIKPSFAAQFIKEDDIGDAFAGKVSSLYWGAKFGVKVSDLSAYVAYSQQSEAAATSGSLEKSTITPWGGMPAYTQGMVTRHMFISGTKASKVAATYDFKNLGANVNATGYYTSFDMDANSGYGLARTATEAGFDVIYYPAAVKNLQLRARGNFPRDFAESTAGTTGWSEYRLIANYNF